MKKSSMRLFITRNPWLKLTSLALAFMLWFYVVSKGRSAIVMDTAIGFKNIPDNLKVINNQLNASITIEGHERLLQKLRKEDVGVMVDLSGAKEGEVIIPVDRRDVSLPKTSSVRVTDISPQAVKLKIETLVKKIVPVRTVTIGSPASGFRVEMIQVVPDSVQIEGPRSIIEKIYHVKTEPLDVTGASGNFQYSARLDITEKSVRIDPTEVSINVVTGKVR